MQRLINVVCAVAIALTMMSITARCDLFGYISRPEPQFKWTLKGQQSVGAYRIYDLHLVSQVWQGIRWEHTIRIFRPAKVQYPRAAMLFITGGEPSSGDNEYGMLVASFIGAPFAILYNIPNQPLFGGLTEDELIAHTFTEFMKTGDETMPLLLPMTKSAVKAMDALQAFSQRQWGRRIDTFVVSGASKRGWTSWLTAVVDKRVKGVIPIVYDNLNLHAQMPHQLEMWGRYSEQIEEYTRRGLQAQMNTERGRRLVEIVDPYSYRQRLRMPKLIINGANDRYWTVDALNLYWDALPGEKWVWYAPNAGHGLDDQRNRAIATIVAFFHHVVGNRPFPRMQWEHSEKDGKLVLTVRAQPKPKAVTLWVARSNTTDFRDSKWVPQQMRALGDAFVGEVSAPKKGFIALFGEAQFTIDGRTFFLSTTIRVAPKLKRSRQSTR